MTTQSRLGSDDTIIRTQFEYAVEAAREGYLVFPCGAGRKTPLIRNWEQEATRDEAKLAGWWKKWPDANIGGAVGASGIVVLDVDIKNGKQGAVSLWNLEDRFGAIPRTRVARTPSGGLHIHMSGITRSRNGFADGIDVKSVGGYVIMPGSWIGGVPYQWAKRNSLVPVPIWLSQNIERGKSAGENEKSTKWDDLADVSWARDYLANDAEPAVQGHSGDNTTFVVACKLRDRGLSESTALRLMEELYNPRCNPPWEVDSASCNSLKAKVRNAYQYANGTAGSRSGAAEFFGEPGSTFRKSKFREIPLTELKDVTAPRWLIDRLIPENGLAVVYGQPKACKTFWAIDLSLCVATGRKFHGQEVRKGRVTYVAAENSPARLNDRVRAWLKSREEDVTSGWGLIAQRADLMSPAEVSELIEALGGTRDLIIIDTLARCMSGDENNQRDMNAFIAGCDRLREATGASVLVIHHEGKDSSKGARGSNALRGAIDTGIRLRREADGTIVSTVEDQRDDEPIEPMRFELRNVPISSIEDASAALFGAEGRAADNETEILEIAIRFIGQKKQVFEEAVEQKLGVSHATAVRRTHAIPEGRDRAVRHGGYWLWLERTNPKNRRSGLIVRGEQISDVKNEDIDET